MVGIPDGRFDDFIRALERAHHPCLDAHEPVQAAGCAVPLGFVLAHRGEIGPAMGWIARAERLVEHADWDCVERGYFLVSDLSTSGERERVLD